MSPRTRDWLIAIGYVALIFSTLQVAPVPLAYLRAHGWLRDTIFLMFLLCTAQALRVLRRNHGRNISRLICLLVLLCVYYFVARTIRLPEEQLHFFEYGLVGIFFLRALRHYNLPAHFLFLVAWLLSSTAGWCDELLQGITPNRHYDLRDIGFNVVASGLGLLLYFICKSNKTH